MIKIKYRGRLGNRLFQYAYARIAAESLGASLPAHPIEGFQATAQVIEGRNHADAPPYVPPEREAPEKLPADRLIVVDGYYQQWETMHRWRAHLLRWLAPRRWPVAVNKDDLLVSVRLGDYLTVGQRFRRAIPSYESFYTPLFEKLRPRRVYLISDQPNHPYITTQFHDTDIVNLSPLDSLRFMAAFRRLVICQSTFAWWGAFLSSTAEEVHLPVPQGSVWQSYCDAISPCELPGWNLIATKSIVDEREEW